MDENFGQAYIDECNDWRSKMAQTCTEDDLLIIQDMLLLLDINIPINEIESWDEEELEDVSEWAGKSILRANDNNVRVPKKPDVLI